MPEVRVLRERCVKCGDCVLLCPQSAAGMEEPVFEVSGDGEVTVAHRENCIGCYTCVEFCRAAALVIAHELSVDDQPDIFPERPLNRII